MPPIVPMPFLASSSLESITQKRREAEQIGDDQKLYELRMMELSYGDLPPRVDDILLEELLWVDQISTIWSGWRKKDGMRCLLRCIRKRWKSDPVMLRRLKRCRDFFPVPTQELVLPIWKEAGDWSYSLYLLGEGQLASYLVSQWDELDWTVVILGALKGLTLIHRTSLSLGVAFEDALLITNARARLLWLDPFPASFEPQKDILNLAQWVQNYGPWHPDSVPALVAEWSNLPPPSAQDALSIAHRSMGERLGDHAQEMRQKGQKLHQRMQGVRLWGATSDLQTPPPVVDIPLLSGKRVYTKNKQLYFFCPVEGDRLVFSPEEGLIIEFGRSLRNDCLRSFSSLHEEEQHSLQALRRWLQCSMQLRRLNGLLRFQLRQLYSLR